jgi:hypothetical protein
MHAFTALLPIVFWLCPSGLPDGMSVGSHAPEELRRLAQTIDSADGSHQSIYMSGQAKIDGALEVKFEARYREPDRFSFCVSDPSTKSPIICQVDHQLLVYNPVEGSLIYLSNASFRCRLCVDTGRLVLFLGAFKSDDPSKIFFDVSSLFGHGAAKSEVRAVGPKDFALVETRATGLIVEAHVDPSRRCPFKSVEITEMSAAQPCIKVDELSVDGDAPSGPWTIFPSKEHLAFALPIKDFSDSAVFGDAEVANAITKSYFAAAALRSKSLSLRKDYEKRFRVRVSWDTAESNDRVISSLIVQEAASPPYRPVDSGRRRTARLPESSRER